PDPEAGPGAELRAAVAAARAADLDPEAALRRTTLAYADAIRAAERTTPRP
ncbi:nucleoside triphosphate pyrophosphohydrolase, partial [Micromonospora harpali]